MKPVLLVLAVLLLLFLAINSVIFVFNLMGPIFAGALGFIWLGLGTFILYKYSKQIQNLLK